MPKAPKDPLKHAKAAANVADPVADPVASRRSRRNAAMPAVAKLHDALESMERARAAAAMAARTVSDAEDDLLKVLENEMEGLPLLWRGKLVYGQEAVKEHRDSIIDHYDPHERIVVEVDEEKLTLLSPFNVGKLLHAVAAARWVRSEAFPELKNQSLQCGGGQVLTWDQPVVDGGKYTTVSAQEFLKFNCNEYTTEEGKWSASEPCCRCPNPFCKSFDAQAMFGPYSPTSPAYSPY
jgi:hypothetical protein